MRSHQDGVRALPQRVGVDRRLGGADRLPKAVGARQHSGGRLEPMEPQLMPILILHRSFRPTADFRPRPSPHRRQFMDEVLRPFGARFPTSDPFRPPHGAR